jgi:hypothetical protein
MPKWIASRVIEDIKDLSSAFDSLVEVARAKRGSMVDPDEVHITIGLSSSGRNELHLYCETFADGTMIFSTKLYIA